MRVDSALKGNKKKKELKKNRIIILVLIILIIIIRILSIDSKVEEVVLTEEELQEISEQKEIEKLADMNERNRMEHYFAVFIDYLERKEYDRAYDLLYDEFKQRYFPTLEDFTEYAKKTFPEMVHVEHDNIERNGDIYVLWVYISDLINGSSEDKKEMNVVIKENDLNDFVLSFSVI